MLLFYRGHASVCHGARFCIIWGTLLMYRGHASLLQGVTILYHIEYASNIQGHAYYMRRACTSQTGSTYHFIRGHTHCSMGGGGTLVIHWARTSYTRADEGHTLVSKVARHLLNRGQKIFIGHAFEIQGARISFTGGHASVPNGVRFLYMY